MATYSKTTITHILKHVSARWTFPKGRIRILDGCISRLFSDTVHENAIAEELCDVSVPLSPENPKTVKVAVIGVPNAGKSTVINSLTGRKVCPISSKVHTTRSRVRAVAVEGNTQIVFLDTPGLVSAEETKRYKLEQRFVRDGEEALMEADVIGVVHDVSNRWTRDRLDPKVLRLLHICPHKDSFLVMNKIDTVKSKRVLLDVVRLVTSGKMSRGDGPEGARPTESELLSAVRQARAWPHFREVFLVSALSGSGMEAIKAYLLERARPGRWVLPVDRVTDQRPEELVETTVRARLLDHLPQELPYRMSTKVVYLQANEHGHLVTVVVVECPGPRFERFVLGKKGERVRTIAKEAELDLHSAFKQPVFLKLVVESADKKQ